MLLRAPPPVGQPGHLRSDGRTRCSGGACSCHPARRAPPSCNHLPAWQRLPCAEPRLCPSTGTRNMPCGDRPFACAHASHSPVHANAHKSMKGPLVPRAQVHRQTGGGVGRRFHDAPGGGARDVQAAAPAGRRLVLINLGTERISTVRASPRDAPFDARSPVPCLLDAHINPQAAGLSCTRARSERACACPCAQDASSICWSCCCRAARPAAASGGRSERPSRWHRRRRPRAALVRHRLAARARVLFDAGLRRVLVGGRAR